jgi:hypothetical protein
MRERHRYIARAKSSSRSSPYFPCCHVAGCASIVFPTYPYSSDLDASSSQRHVPGPCRIWPRRTIRTLKAGLTTTATSTERSCVRP